MYVCLCKGVTDKQIRNAVAEGASSLRDLRQALDVATQCGKCASDCRAHLADMLCSQPLANQGVQFVAA
ncbi:MAG: hypothetical protein CVV16_03135 [Gammaproteobacteria bacterium HGW-Gammaproteobacteria-6]|nr:MAG: hypothetical protein CVV16_03135 [Gammaproteobacteria bacterium HGW-Gammaproteobacteria-6]